MSQEKKKALGKGLESLLPRRSGGGNGAATAAIAATSTGPAAETAALQVGNAEAGEHGTLEHARTGVRVELGGVVLTAEQRAVLERELLRHLSRPVAGDGSDGFGEPHSDTEARKHGSTGGGSTAGGTSGDGRTEISPEARAVLMALKAGALPQLPPSAVTVPQIHEGFAPGVSPEVYKEAMERLAEYAPGAVDTTRTGTLANVVLIPLRLIERNPFQTRVTGQNDPTLAELTESIKSQGVLEPILVRPMKRAGVTGQMYQLIAGERRWLASQNAGKQTIPALVREVSDEQTMVITIIENLHRVDLNPMQHARAFRRLGDEFRLTQEEIAQRTGMSRPAVTNYLRLTRLPEWVRTAIEENRLSFGHAKVLLQVAADEHVLALAKKVVAGGLSVRETEILVDDFARPPVPVPTPERKVDPNVRAAEMELERALGCRVRIADRKGKGKIVIEYNTLEDFDRVVEALK